MKNNEKQKEKTDGKKTHKIKKKQKKNRKKQGSNVIHVYPPLGLNHRRTISPSKNHSEIFIFKFQHCFLLNKFQILFS